MASSTGSNNAGRASSAKWLWVAGVLPSSFVAILLLVGDTKLWTHYGDFYHIVTQNRASIAIIVQTLSRLLRIGNICVLCSLSNFGTRLLLVKTSLSLNQLQFATVLCGRQLDWALPTGFLGLLLGFKTITVVLGALWAEALTPVMITVLLETKQSIDVPQYGPESRITWGSLTWVRPNPSERSPQGVFSYPPNYDLIGVILTQAASASKFGDTTPTFRKLIIPGIPISDVHTALDHPLALLMEVLPAI